MPGQEVVAAQHGEGRSVDALAEAVAAANPGYHLGAGSCEDGAELVPAAGGVRYIWLLDGVGEVLLPAGYRTREGDGQRLPPSYSPDSIPPELAEALGELARGLDEVHLDLRAPASAIAARRDGDHFYGDIAGDVWLLYESGLPESAWAPTQAVRESLSTLARAGSSLGWATKNETGWEPLRAGDQLVATPEMPVRVRGQFRYWWIEDAERQATHCSTARRLRYLRDTAGGCSPGFDEYRRLPLTWRVRGEGDDPDGVNRVNSHVVHIEAVRSRTHYHPVPAVGGGRPQTEMYFVMDPSSRGLHSAGGPSRLYTFPEIGNWYRYQVVELAPGTAVFIPPMTAHRGLDVFVNVVTIPGFKPGNEIYVDREIRRATDGKAPHNPATA